VAEGQTRAHATTEKGFGEHDASHFGRPEADLLLCGISTSDREVLGCELDDSGAQLASQWSSAAQVLDHEGQET
jgi:hypothetical protein